jgi:hypothetical protein
MKESQQAADGATGQLHALGSELLAERGRETIQIGWSHSGEEAPTPSQI